MQTIYFFLKKQLPLLLAVGFALILSACGTYNNYPQGETDGIYASEKATAEAEVEESVDKSNYYKQYFQSKEKAYDELQEGDIFTDVDAYSTRESMDNEGYVVTEEAEYENEGWGNESANVEVNIYGGNQFGFGYGYRPFWHGNAWGSPWYRPFWNIGFGWGWGYYGWGYSNYCWGGYYAPFYNNYDYGNYYGGYGHQNSYAYNRGRRSGDSYAGRSARTRGRVGSKSSRGRSAYNRSGVSSRNRSTVGRSRSSVSRPNVNSRPSSRPNSSVNSRPSSTKPRINNNRSTSRPSVTRPSVSRPSVSRPSSGSSRSSGRKSGSSRRGGRG